MATLKRYTEQCVELIELKNVIEEKDTQIEEVKAEKDQEKQMAIKDKDIELERVVFEKAKENFALKQNLQKQVDYNTSLNKEVGLLKIQPRDGSEITSSTLSLVDEVE